MEKPAEIEFRFDDVDGRVEQIVRRKIGDLERIYPRLTTCRVMVELPHRQHTTGNLYHVVINMGVPEEELVIDMEKGDDTRATNLTSAVNDAFSRAKRKLKRFAERQNAARPT